MFFVIVILCPILLFLTCFVHSIICHRYWAKKKVAQAKPFPFIGNIFELGFGMKQFGVAMADIYKKFNAPFFGIYIFNTPYLVLKSLDLIKSVLVTDFNHFFDHLTKVEKDVDPITAHFLFFLKSHEWKETRTKISPVFTSAKLKNMFELMQDVGGDLKNHLIKLDETKVLTKPVKVKEFCSKFTIGVISSCAFGVNCYGFESPESEFSRMGKNVFADSFVVSITQLAYFIFPTVVKFLKPKFIDETSSKFFMGAFWKVMDDREKSGTKRNDLIDILVEIRKRENWNDAFDFTGIRLVSQALQFVGAGLETTSTAMSFTLYELALNSNVQTKLRDEIKSTLSEHGTLTYENVQSMKYLNMVVSETLRKYPALAALDRECASDYTIPGTEIVIKKGTIVFVPVYGLHYDPKYYPDPEKFDPERFSPENLNSIPSMAYLPFGDGPRNCIGQRFALLSSKIGLATILSEFEVEVCEETQIPAAFNRFTFFLAPNDGVKLKLKRCG